MRNKVEIVLFIVFLSLFGLAYIIFPQREFSEMENDYLTLCPKFQWKDFIEGDFSRAFEEYTADQILGKDWLVKNHVLFRRGLGITLINGVYIGKDGYLIQDYQEPEGNFKQNLDYIREFAVRNPNVKMTMLVAPNVNQIYPELLPSFAETYSQKTVLEELEAQLSGSVQVVDVEPALEAHREEYIYYKTDHHWTSLGAYYAYAAFCEASGLTPLPIDKYDRQELPEPFYGSLYSKTPLYGQESDRVELFWNPEGIYRVSYPVAGQERDSMFVLEQADKKDKYTVFFGGNDPLVVINSNGANPEPVLIIKDSYANCLVPMLADQYREIHMIDLRYYHEDIDAYIEENKIKQVIFIHNIDFLSTDNNFLWLQS